MTREHVVPTLFRPPALRRAVILFALVWAVIGADTAHAGGSVTVMTQNLYQGTEFAQIQKLVKGERPISDAFTATTEDYATYLGTHFKDRAKQIAAEIVKNKPVLVGLQEVATWHRGLFNPSAPFALPGPVSEDFTEELVGALAADGVHYAPVSKHENNFTLAFPVFIPGPVAVGMVESGEILARTDLPAGQLQVSNPMSETYGTNIPPLINPINGEAIPFTDSWQSIDANVQGKAFRFITTHLDSQDSSGLVRGIQAKELLAGLALNTSLPVVVTGDMNSGPKDPPPPFTVPAAYKAFLEGGLADSWTKAGLGVPPLTCCHLEFNDLVDNPAAMYTQELDHVLTQGNLPVVDEHLVGNTVPSPPPEPFIWPSDHAGVVATLGFGSCGVRWHYSANGGSGGWSGTGGANCEQAITLGPQAMEGDLKVNPGAPIKAGYDFTLPGNKSPFTASFTEGKVVFAVHCVSGATPSAPTLTVTLPSQSYPVESNSSWYPSGHQHSSLVYQGEIAAPNLCGGGQLRLDQGGAFSASMTIH
jgi:hypothetical protein